MCVCLAINLFLKKKKKKREEEEEERNSFYGGMLYDKSHKLLYFVQINECYYTRNGIKASAVAQQILSAN